MQAEELWRLAADGTIQFQRLTPLGSLLVSTDNSLSAIDPATGKALWTRDDVKKLKECNCQEIPNTPYGMFDFGEGVGGTQRRVEVVDLATGEKKWDSTNLPIASSQGVLLALQKDMLIVAGVQKKGGKTTLLGVDVATGELKWEQEKLFSKPVALYEVRGSGKLFKRYAIEGCQEPVFDSENTAILFLSEDGPVEIDLATGDKLWTADKLKGLDPSAPRDGYAQILLSGDGGTASVPYKKSVMAIDTKTGAPIWPKDHDFKSRVAQMALTPQGLVVRGQPQLNEKKNLDGKPFIDVLDPKTGESVWKKPFRDMEGATAFDIHGDQLYIAADGELFAIGLAEGTPKSIMKLKFKGKEDPSQLEVRGDDYVLISAQNVMRVDPSGNVKYHTFYDAPGQAGWIKVLSTAAIMAANATSAATAHSQAMANPGTEYKYTLITKNPELSRRFKASSNADDFVSIQTTVDDGGKKGSGIVRVEKEGGKEVARVYLGDKTPEYEMDAVDGRLFYLKSDKEIIAFKF